MLCLNDEAYENVHALEFFWREKRMSAEELIELRNILLRGEFEVVIDKVEKMVFLYKNRAHKMRMALENIHADECDSCAHYAKKILDEDEKVLADDLNSE